MKTIDTTTLAANILSENSHFLISPNIAHYALSAEEKQYQAQLIADANEIDPRSINGRLLQAKHTRDKLTKAMRDALMSGEPEDSDYVDSLRNKIVVLIQQIAQLEALVK